MLYSLQLGCIRVEHSFSVERVGSQRRLSESLVTIASLLRKCDNSVRTIESGWTHTEQKPHEKSGCWNSSDLLSMGGVKGASYPYEVWRIQPGALRERSKAQFVSRQKEERRKL